MNNEPVFDNYKQKQNYYREKYKNRGETVWVSKMIGKDGKVLQPGRTYEKDNGALAKVVKKKMNSK